MSFDPHNELARKKRAEQLKRWKDSEANRAPIAPKNPTPKRVKFSPDCEFLAACLSGDIADVIQFIENGVGIDTVNFDGLTALHQACIDGNSEMVEFLIQHGADINKEDNEGWTPLHATASCGFLGIARYLLMNNANIAAVNCDGNLPIDLTDCDYMRALLENHLNEQGIDCDEARQSEEKLMQRDAESWLRSNASETDRPHPGTGATALHVAAAKGYNKVLSILLATGADVKNQDNEGWTPLHAATHWGQTEATQILAAALADIDAKNHYGQTPMDVADPSIVKFLEELQNNKNPTVKRKATSQIHVSDDILPPKIVCVVMKSNIKNVDDFPKTPNEPTQTTKERQLIANEVQITSIRHDHSYQVKNSPEIQIPRNESNNLMDSNVILRRTFGNDEKFHQKYLDLRQRMSTNSCPVLASTLNADSIHTNAPTTSTVTTSNDFTVQRSTPIKDRRSFEINSLPPATVALLTATNYTLDTNTMLTPTTPVTQQQKKSFVPSPLDEQSGSHRKTRAKRSRETRRSRQSVTLEEIKSAEELVKKNNLDHDTTTKSDEKMKK